MRENRFSSKGYKQEASSKYNKRNSSRRGKNKAKILVSKIVLTALRCLCKALANNDYWPYHVCASVLPTVHIE